MPKRSPERTSFLGDVISTAVEGGTGYWSQVSQYQYELSGEIRACVGARVGDDPRAVLHRLKDYESGYEDEGLVVTLEVVARGIAHLINKGGVDSDMRDMIKEADEDNDAGMIDVDAADAIVQAGLFGEVVYG